MKWRQPGADYCRHMPRLGAPQAQGPGSDAAGLADDPETAKTESICVTLELAHFLQVTGLEEEATIFSNLVPQSLHSNSNMGMGGLSSYFCDSFNISKSKIAFKPQFRDSLMTGVKPRAKPHFLRAGVKWPFGITLDSPMDID